jgi:hypothetical protein
MHKIKNDFHTYTSTATTSREMSSNPLPKQSTSHQHPFISAKSHASIIGNEYADALARKSITTYSDVADTSINKASPDRNPFISIYWLAKEYKDQQII